MRRFFIDEPLRETITIRGQDAHHIGRVLRLAPGADIIVVTKDGQAVRARITTTDARTVTAVFQERLAGRAEPDVEVWLAQGLPKGDKMDFIVQKAVEIGAAGVIPMAVDYCTVRYDAEKQRLRVARWQKIAAEAAKQCGRDVVPEVTPVRSLGEVLTGVGPDTAVIMLYEGQTGKGLKDVLAGFTARSYLLLIGPEGGFSLAEAEVCQEYGGRLARLGPRILRTETAAVAVLAVVMYEKGDMGTIGNTEQS